MGKRSSGKQGLINTGRNTMFAKRNAKGQFKEMDDLGRSLSADRRTAAKRSVKAGARESGETEADGWTEGREEVATCHHHNVTRTSRGRRWTTRTCVLPCSYFRSSWPPLVGSAPLVSMTREPRKTAAPRPAAVGASSTRDQPAPPAD